jgi:hypothetical protein
LAAAVFETLLLARLRIRAIETVYSFHGRVVDQALEEVVAKGTCAAGQDNDVVLGTRIVLNRRRQVLCVLLDDFIHILLTRLGRSAIGCLAMKNITDGFSQSVNSRVAVNHTRLEDCITRTFLLGKRMSDGVCQSKYLKRVDTEINQLHSLHH